MKHTKKIRKNYISPTFIFLVSFLFGTNILTVSAQQGGGIQLEKEVPVIESLKWSGPKLADGQPDISGHWSNTIANHNNFTDPHGGIPNNPNPRNMDKKPRNTRAPGRVSDPADGQVPFQPWALEKVKEFQVKFHNPVEQEFVEPGALRARWYS